MIFTETRAINETLWGLRNKVPLILQQGGTSCFAPETLILTTKGKKPISEIQKGDEVVSFNEQSGKDEPKRVLAVKKFNNTKRTIRVKLKNGNVITATEDHQFYYKGRWVELKKLIALKEENDRNLEKDTGF